MMISLYFVLALGLISIINCFGLTTNLRDTQTIKSHAKRDDKDIPILNLFLNDDNQLVTRMKIGDDADAKNLFVDFIYADTWVIAGDQFVQDGHDNLKCHVPPALSLSYAKSDMIETKSSDKTVTLQVSTSDGSLITLDSEPESDYDDRPYVDKWCTSDGYFDPVNGSESFKTNDSAPIINVMDGYRKNLSGFYGYDSFTFSNLGHRTEVPDVSFAVLNDSYLNLGNLGLGFPEFEYTKSGFSAYVLKDGYVYENFPQRLKNTGTIDKMMYSLYFDGNQTHDTGSVVLGAVDIEKYHGELKIIDLVNDLENHGYDEPVRFTVTTKKIALIDSEEDEIFSKNVTVIPAVLALTRLTTSLPLEIIESLKKTIDLRYDEDSDMYYTRCGNLDDGKSLSFEFDGYTLNVPLTAFKLTTNYISEHRGNNSCYLLLKADFSDNMWLGRAVASSLYVVFDLEDRKVSVAPASFSKESNLITIDESSDYETLKKDASRVNNSSNHDDGDDDDDDDDDAPEGSAARISFNLLLLLPLFALI